LIDLKKKVDDKTATKEEELSYYTELNSIADFLNISLDNFITKIKK